MWALWKHFHIRKFNAVFFRGFFFLYSCPWYLNEHLSWDSPRVIYHFLRDGRFQHPSRKTVAIWWSEAMDFFQTFSKQTCILDVESTWELKNSSFSRFLIDPRAHVESIWWLYTWFSSMENNSASLHHLMKHFDIKKIFCFQNLAQLNNLIQN